MGDLLKQGLSREKGIQLVVVTAEDLSKEGMLAKLPEVLPRRAVEDGPYLRALERLSQEYRGRAQAWRAVPSPGRAGGAAEGGG